MIDMDKEFTTTGYKNLIKSFITAGYSFEPFDGRYSTEAIVYLRHDVDFSVDYAYDMAVADHSLGVTATFFFLPNSELYNLYSKQIIDLVNEIIRMGHAVCLHIDADIINRLDTALNCFKMIYPMANTGVISYHQPKGIPPNIQLMKGVVDVYSPQFVTEIEYASDSGGEWKYGYPLCRPSFARKGSFQLLTHPLWWMSSGSDINSAIDCLVDKIHSRTLSALGQFRFMQEHKSQNTNSN